ncbi:hypothetical protein FKM82_025611 [Ascaphus truei]
MEALGRNKTLLQGDLPRCLKKNVFDQSILSVLTYGSETWTLQTTQRSTEMHAGYYPQRQEKRMNGFETKQVCDIIRGKKLKWRWVRHIKKK